MPETADQPKSVHMKTATQGPSQTQERDLNRQQAPPNLNLRVKALESVLVEKGLVDPAGLDALIDAFQNKVDQRVVAHPRVDRPSKPRLSCFNAVAVHAAPVYLDREATLNKACYFIREAARQPAPFAAFPPSI